MRFLIDECLTVDLAREAERAGYEAHHVAHLGKASWNDWAIRDYAVNGDFILVTHNASDFRRLYAATDMHPRTGDSSAECCAEDTNSSVSRSNEEARPVQ